jgi:hypothetical protein
VGFVALQETAGAAVKVIFCPEQTIALEGVILKEGVGRVLKVKAIEEEEHSLFGATLSLMSTVITKLEDTVTVTVEPGEPVIVEFAGTDELQTYEFAFVLRFAKVIWYCMFGHMSTVVPPVLSAT